MVAVDFCSTHWSRGSRVDDELRGRADVVMAVMRDERRRVAGSCRNMVS